MVLPVAPVGIAIVVAWNSDPGHGEPIDKAGPFFKFFRKGGRRKIAAEKDQVCAEFFEESREGFELRFGKMVLPRKKPIQIAQDPFRKKAEWVPSNMGEMKIGNLNNTQKNLRVTRAIIAL